MSEEELQVGDLVLLAQRHPYLRPVDGIGDQPPIGLVVQVKRQLREVLWIRKDPRHRQNIQTLPLSVLVSLKDLA